MGRVLIAEDETIIRLDLRAQLEDAGHVVAGEARDGAEAVELARTLQPDVVLLDVKMPKLDGIEAAKRIRSESPVPIVMVTAYGEQELVRRAADAGAYGYLLKPFGANDVGAAVEMATARHRELEELRDEVGTLQDALAARKAIERAKGLLMEREGLTEAEAFVRMRTASQRSGQSLKLIAEAIVIALG